MKRHREKRYTLNDYIPMAQVVFRHNRDQAGVRSALRRLRDSFLADMYIDDIERSDIGKCPQRNFDFLRKRIRTIQAQQKTKQSCVLVVREACNQSAGRLSRR